MSFETLLVKFFGGEMLKAVIIDGWAYCPLHKTKLCRVDVGACAKGIKLWCKQCRAEIEFDT